MERIFRVKFHNIASILILFAASLTVLPVHANGPLNIPVISTTAAALPVEIAPNDPYIRYGGRFDFSDPSSPECEWPASCEELAFTGTSLNIRLDEGTNHNRYEIIVDGQITAILAPINGAHLYNVFSSATSGTHIVELVKRTESLFGAIRFEGFQLSSGGTVGSLPVSNGRGIEVIGDSISCGAATETTVMDESVTSTNEDSYLSYGNVAATALGAEFADISGSGRSMWPDYTMPSIYDYVIPTNSDPIWNFSWVPGAVIIDLGANDFKYGPPDEAGWTTAYEQFIAHLRTHYPSAMIYCSTSPMVGGADAVTLLTYLQKIVRDEANTGDRRVKVLDIPTEDGTLGYGGDHHPSLEEHQLMAGIVLSQLQADLGWTVSVVPAAPITLSAAVTANEVTLTWNSAGYATSFSVKRSTTSGGPYATIGTVTTQAAIYNDTSVRDGVTYYYVVSGTNSAGTGPNSAQVSATPMPAPSSPAGLTARPGNNSVMLSWSAVSAPAVGDLNPVQATTTPH
jgi:hypothetical protein